MADPQAELRAAAEKATPGPWWVEDEIIWADDDSTPALVAQVTQPGDELDDQGRADAAFIAAASPDVVLELLAAEAERDGLRAENERLRALREQDALVAEEYGRAQVRAETERDVALAQLADTRRTLDVESAKVRAVELIHCWTNEDGKRFMFVSDVQAALGLPIEGIASGNSSEETNHG